MHGAMGMYSVEVKDQSPQVERGRRPSEEEHVKPSRFFGPVRVRGEYYLRARLEASQVLSDRDIITYPICTMLWITDVV